MKNKKSDKKAKKIQIPPREQMFDKQKAWQELLLQLEIKDIPEGHRLEEIGGIAFWVKIEE